MKIELIGAPTKDDWIECRRRALVTMWDRDVWNDAVCAPSPEWKHKILEARHSPIRYLRYSFLMVGIPSNVSVHLCRHVHAQPYVSSLRNDRQDAVDGDAARRDAPVNMILDVNAEELMAIANKRLCRKAAPKTRDVVQKMCWLAEERTPELNGLLAPMCEYHGNVCHEMKPCGRLLLLRKDCKNDEENAD